MAVIFLLLVAALFWALASVSQRSLYWKTRARAYRNPEANEPSDFTYSTQHTMFVVFALIFTIGSIALAVTLGWFTGNETQVWAVSVSRSN
jgi:drug/metabolite transporter (DMT)-like permease